VARPKRERAPDPDRLVRRSAGDLHTEDGRFEVSSTGGAGRWYLTDTERHDQLGLPLILGPYGTLDEVRVAITAQRASPSGGEGPLPEPGPEAVRTPAPRKPARPRPAPEPEPEPGPEPEPSRPPVRIRMGRWRKRGDERDAVVEVVRRVNDSWLSGDVEAMSSDLHESVVFAPPEPGARLEGREDAVGSYRDFTSSALIEAFTERDLTVDVVGGTAVATYRYELDWEADGEGHHDIGRDLLVLTRDGDRWLIAWRTTIPG
jgi:ketosteroid isomerase-like protein